MRGRAQHSEHPTGCVPAGPAVEHRHRVGETAVVLAQRAVRVDRLELGDDVQLATGIALKRDVGGGFEASTEAAPGPADPLGDGADLAVRLGEDRDDPVGLAELDATQHHALIPVETHGLSLMTGS